MHALPPASFSSSLYLSVPPERMNLFRFLLESYDNLALFTMLSPSRGLLKLIFSPDQQVEVEQALQAIAALVPLQYIDSGREEG